MNPLVSVIVPAYNADKYLVETLDSIMRSTYRPIEVIVVDDGSRDHTLSLATAYAETHELCHIYTQPNAGVSVARNHAIRMAQGKYILPVDADDQIGPTYIEHAVAAMENDSTLRVVGCRARMFGEVEKEWKLPPFSHALLARKNMIHVTSLFRREDWETVGGFCEQDIYREDWDFWLSLFELGGNYLRLNEIGLYYRVSKRSRRMDAKQQKHAIVDAINRRHPTYMQRYLGGPLHYHRSWSRLLNIFRHERQVGEFSHWQDGDIIHDGRNTIRRYEDCVIKQFGIPTLWRGILYGLFVPTKARRSYEYALRLGDMTPAAVAYREVRVCGVLRESYYVCRLSTCTHTFNDLIDHPEFPNRNAILQSIGRFTAALHQQGIWHSDYSGGNILFDERGEKIQIVDLNRLRFRVRKQPLLGFERLNIDRNALRTMVTAYAEVQGINPDEAVDFVIRHRWHKHVKQGITNL